MAGRPLYDPSPADRATVQNLAALGVSHDEIAKCIGQYGVTAKTLRKHFRRELTISLTEVKAVAMSKLVAAINAGEQWAVKFFLERKAGFEETSSHRLVDKDGKDRSLTLADIDASIAAADEAGVDRQAPRLVPSA
jgi:hypothetical protein